MSAHALIMSAAGAGGGGPPPPPPPPPLPPFSSIGCICYYDPGNTQSYPGTGSTIYDVGGENNHGTINNATWDGSLNNGVFVFNGAAGDNFIMTPNMFSLITSSALTIEVWIRATAAGSAIMEVGQNSISTGYRANNIELGSVGPFFAPRGGFRTTSGTTTYNGPSTPGALNQWNQYVVTFSGTTPIMYRNGANKGGIANTGTRFTFWNQAPMAGQTSNYYGLAFGAGSSQNSLALTSAMFTGRMGIMRAYQRILTDAEILYNYEGSKSRYGLA